MYHKTTLYDLWHRLTLQWPSNARSPLDKDLSCWRRLPQYKFAGIAECAKLNVSRLTAVEPVTVEVIIRAQWITMY